MGETPLAEVRSDSGATASAEAQSLGGIPYELRLGITGHRDLANADQVRRAVDHLLQELAAVFASAAREPHGPHGSPRSLVDHFDRGLTYFLAKLSLPVCGLVNCFQECLGMPSRWRWPPVPVSGVKLDPTRETSLKLTLVTGLAHGADQIVAESLQTLLEQNCPPGVVPARNRRRYIEAVLPFAVEEFEQDFPPGEERDRFHRLFALDRGVGKDGGLTPSPTILHPDYREDGPHEGLSRSEAYRTVGRYVVESCELLIAIWDPTRTEGAGGTAETARFAISQGRTVLWIDPQHLDRGVRTLVADSPDGSPDQNAADDVPSGLTALPLFPASGNQPRRPTPVRAKDLSRNFHGLAAYNRDSAVTSEELAAAEASARGEFLAAADGNLPPEVVEIIVSRVLPRLVRADQLSVRYRNLRGVAVWLWPTLGALAVTGMAAQVLFLPHAFWFAWIEVAVLLLCGLAYRVSRHESWHDKWLNDRRLAEGLRSALHASLVRSAVESPIGVHPGKSGRGVENPLPFYSAGKSWLVSASKRIVHREWPHFDAAISWERDLKGIATYLRETWIEGQLHYHEANAKRHHHLASRYALLRWLILAGVVLIAVLHGFGVGHAHPHADKHEGSHGHVDNPVPLYQRVDLWIAWATVSLPAWGAAVHAFSTAEDHERLKDRSERMARILTGVARQMAQVTSGDQLAECVWDAESLLDLENQEWSESLADRVPEWNA
ncbi:MAG: hypothetical protein KDA75_09065 [Planctomycetaceae bacterium]|nr:hypothetical protein [Planctomycetaceae bacterium]